MPREQADLVVVGASVGGLAAAAIAANRGLKIFVLDRAKELGGGAGPEAESIAAAGSRFQAAAGLDDGPDRLADDVQAATRHRVDAAVAAAVAAQGGPLVAWLADRCGIPIELVRVPGAGHSTARLHLPGERGGETLVAALVRAATRHPRVTARTGALVERLVRDETGAVRGVGLKPDRRGGVHEVMGAVLLACGGFAADDARVAEVAPDVARLPYHGFAGATGEALRLGAEAGARTDRLGAFRVTPFLAMPGAHVVSAPLVPRGAILVNQAGRRFADETGEALSLAATVLAQPGRVAYLLFDERIAAEARAADPHFTRVVLPRVGRRALSLKDLARQFELDLDALTLTVDTWNANTDLGGDPFGRTAGAGRLEAPFHAIRVTGARWRSLGGLAVDARARVLGADGQPIPGLYAAGGAAVGFGGEGCEGALPGVDALAALGLGRLAALDVIAGVSSE
jgi:fumarate reductase flavoprotein subunit